MRRSSTEGGGGKHFHRRGLEKSREAWSGGENLKLENLALKKKLSLGAVLGRELFSGNSGKFSPGGTRGRAIEKSSARGGGVRE